jgi:hypothetical protein
VVKKQLKFFKGGDEARTTKRGRSLVVPGVANESPGVQGKLQGQQR